MRLLSNATVDTFVVVRSTVPIFTQLGEVFFLGADWPNRDKWLALLVTCAGASGFAFYNRAAATDAATVGWAGVYLLCITVDMLVVKRIVTAAVCENQILL